MVKSNEEEPSVEFEGSSEPKNFHILRADNELFHDDKYVPLPIINVKRVSLPRNGEDWEIFEDGELILTLKGTRFTNNEKKYLRTVDGMKFLMESFKTGKRSVVKIKEELKKLV